MPLHNEGLTRTFRQNVILAVTLASVAGAVNAAGFFVLGTHTSHMTGQVATVGEAMAGGRSDLALVAAGLLLAFVAGAATAAALLDLTVGRPRGRYTPVLALEVAVLTTAALWASRGHGIRTPILGWALCFAMGLQNAMVTRISGAVVRTTHLTGVLTDFGMETTRLVKWLFKRPRHRGLRSLWHATRQEFERAWLHLALVGAFLAGATAGPVLLFYSNEAALALPCLVLMGLIVLDWQPPHRGENAPPASS